MKRERGPCPDSTALLLAAAWVLDVERVRYLLATTSADINATDTPPHGGGNTALIMACGRDGGKGEELANVLLDYGAATCVFRSDRMTAGLLAIETGCSVALVKRIYGGQFGAMDDPWMILRSLARRKVEGHAELFRFLAMQPNHSMFLTTNKEECQTLLMLGLHERNHSFLRQFLQFIPHNITNPSALEVACKAQIDVDIIKWMVRRWNPSSSSSSSSSEETRAFIRVSLEWNAEYARLLLHEVPEIRKYLIIDKSVWDQVRPQHCSDPIALIDAFRVAKPDESFVHRLLRQQTDDADRLVWAIAHVYDFSTILQLHIIEHAREHCWRLLTPIVCGGGSLLLHGCVRNGHIESMRLALQQHNASPFWRTVGGQNAFWFATNQQKLVAMHAALKEATRFVPERRVARWYGPYFQRRAWTFLLCNHRLWRLGRDLRLMVVRMLADMESI